MRVRLGWVLVAVLVSTVAHADPRTRHIYVSGLSEGDVATIVSPTTGDPVGVVADGEVLPPPPGGAQREDEAMLHAPPEAQSGSASPAEMHPDRLTDTVTSTDYFETFTPAIAPYKRVASYDAVRVEADGTPVLIVANPVSEAVTILGANPPAAGVRDAFWGSVMLDFRRGDRVAIPSVAPDARLLHARSEPAIDFVIEVDSAGNYFVHSLEPVAGIVRFTFLTDASRGFFGRPPGSQRSDAASATLPEVPASVRQRGLTFAAELGIGPSTPIDRALDRLVEHFRSFVESSEMPSPTGDTYLDLARGGVGVCRHRAYAFVVTALALGIPANYVQNEAHAWVEVRLRDGWLRVDLGGSAQGVNAHGLQDRPRHDVAANDPFPQPEIFVRDYLERGVAPEAEPQGGSAGDEASESASNGSNSNGSSSGGSNASGSNSGGSNASGANPNAAQGPNAPATSGSQRPREGAPDPSAGTDENAASVDERRATNLVLDSQTMRVYRGQMLDLAGQLTVEDGSAVSEARIEIHVEGTRLLGVALTDGAGRFSVSLGIPPDLGIGQHPLRIEFVGNRDLRPARAP